MTKSDAGRLGGLKNKGERNPNAKLNAGQVRNIRELRKRGMRRIAIAKAFEISPQHVTRLCAFERWGK